MKRSIIPLGFESVAHAVYHNYCPPDPFESITLISAHSKLNNVDKVLQSNHQSEKQCSICLENFVSPITLMKCNHHFCQSCIIYWFNIKLSCPLCNTECIGYIQFINRDVCKVWRIRSMSSYKQSQDDEERLLSSAIHAHNLKFMTSECLSPYNKKQKSSIDQLNSDMKGNKSLKRHQEFIGKHIKSDNDKDDIYYFQNQREQCGIHEDNNLGLQLAVEDVRKLSTKSSSSLSCDDTISPPSDNINNDVEFINICYEIQELERSMMHIEDNNSKSLILNTS